MFEFRIPVRTEEFFEYIDKSFCEDLFRFSLFDGEGIETKRILFIRRIEYNDVIFSILGYMHHNFFDEVPMGIDDSDSLSIVDVIYHLSDEEFALSDTGLSHDIGVSEAIFIIYPYRYSYTPIIGFCKNSETRIMRRYSYISFF